MLAEARELEPAEHGVPETMEAERARSLALLGGAFVAALVTGGDEARRQRVAWGIAEVLLGAGLRATARTYRLEPMSLSRWARKAEGALAFVEGMGVIEDPRSDALDAAQGAPPPATPFSTRSQKC